MSDPRHDPIPLTSLLLPFEDRCVIVVRKVLGELTGSASLLD